MVLVLRGGVSVALSSIIFIHFPGNSKVNILLPQSLDERQILKNIAIHENACHHLMYNEKYFVVCNVTYTLNILSNRMNGGI